MNCNLLTDPCLTVRLSDGSQKGMSLPQALSALEGDRIQSFARLQAHQSHPWHAFLCQLAAMALEGRELPPGEGLEPHQLLGEHTPEQWTELLRGLTTDFTADEPWTLVVEDLSRPAFLQPPVPEGTWTALDKEKSHPDDLDVLVSARSHGVKAQLQWTPAAEDWVYCLLSLQTNGCFMGAGNYGIARQNGGYATRPGVALALGQTPGTAWVRDTRIILDHGMDHFLSRVAEFNINGIKLVWLEPWKGTVAESLGLSKLHPLFIEICRRVRLREADEKITAQHTGTKALRIKAKDYKGNLADPWIPIRRDDASAFNRRPTYGVIRQVLLDRGIYEPALLQKPALYDRDRDAVVRFRVLVRGEGKTEGYVERAVAVPASMLSFLDERSDEAAAVAEAMASMASAVERNVLKPALVQAMQASRPFPEYKQKETNAWAEELVREFDQELDRHFFAWLWTCLEALESADQDTDYLAPWRGFLKKRATAFFQQTLESLPVPGALRYKAFARAEGRFHGGMKQALENEKGGKE
jgi:CRISPR system Cascade subunit CasA